MDNAAVALRHLLEAAWTASALAHLLERGVDEVIPYDDPAVGLLSNAGLLEDADGGYLLKGREALKGMEPFVLANIRSSLGQASAIANCRDGWAGQDEDVLLAQGVSSSAGARGFADLLLHLVDLQERFVSGGVFLDVGVGVAALACAFCEAVPGSKVIGLDVLPQALKLAEQLVADKGLQDRVDLRQVGIEDFEDEAVADLAHMSPVFIPPAVLTEGMKRIHRALKPGGWVVLSGIVVDGPESAALRWMIHNAGGSALSDTDVAELAAATGFDPPMAAPLPPEAPRLLLLKRTQTD